MKYPIHAVNLQLFSELSNAQEHLILLNLNAEGSSHEHRRLEKVVDGLRAKLIRNNMGLVGACVKRYKCSNFQDEADLKSAGLVGLVKAVDGFQVERGFQFSTYAQYQILGSVHAAYLSIPSIRLSAQNASACRRMKDMAAELYRINSSEPTAEELAETTGYSLRLVSKLMPMIAPFVQLDSEYESGGLVSETVADDGAEHPGAAAVHADDLSLLDELWDSLDERDQFVLEAHFGLAGTEKKTNEKIGAMIDLSGERARQILHAAIGKLRLALRDRETSAAPADVIAQQVKACSMPGEAERLDPQSAEVLPAGFERFVNRTTDGDNHHLWNNNGTWSLSITVADADGETRRVRPTLKTKDVGVARSIRDRIVAGLAGMPQPYVCTKEQLNELICRMVSGDGEP